MAYCVRCDRYFVRRDSLQQHLSSSSAHWSRTQGWGERPGLHGDTLPASRSIITPQRLGEDSSLGETDKTYLSTPRPEYVGVAKVVVKQVFSFVCRHRMSLPPVDEVIRRTDTPLATGVVLVLMEAACRLNPLDNSPEGKHTRLEWQRRRAERAQQAEDAFVGHLDRLLYPYLRETELKEQAASQETTVRCTPDVLFDEPVMLHGRLCHWIEYKHYFGFPKNPFVAGKEKRQMQKYLACLGPGVVVYELGFQMGHLTTEGVRVFHIRDILDALAPRGL